MQSVRRLIVLSLLCLGLLVAGAVADTIRVTTWNLKWFPSGSPKRQSAEVESARIRQAARLLAILNPDVLLLQEVRDQAACEALARAMEPVKYQVMVCTNFDVAGTGAPGSQQVAILAKRDAIGAWAKKWEHTGPVDPPRGFAFAVIPFGDQRVGFYSVHLKSNLVRGDREQEEKMNVAKRETSAQLLIEHAALMRKDYPGIAGFVIAGDFNTNPDDAKFASERTLRLLAGDGFANPILKLAQKNRITWPSDGKYPDATFDHIFTRGLAPVGTPEILGTPVSDHRAVTVELRLP